MDQNERDEIVRSGIEAGSNGYWWKDNPYRKGTEHFWLWHEGLRRGEKVYRRQCEGTWKSDKASE